MRISKIIDSLFLNFDFLVIIDDKDLNIGFDLPGRRFDAYDVKQESRSRRPWY